MKALLRNRLVMGAGGAALLGAAAGALAETRAASAAGRTAYIEDVAARLEVSPEALRAAMLAAADDRIDAAAAAGRLTQARAQSLKLEIRGVAPSGRLAESIARRRGRGLRRVLAHELDVAPRSPRPGTRREAFPVADLTAPGPVRSANGLRAAAIATAKTRLDAAVAGGEMSVEQERRVLRRLARRVDAVLERTWVRGTDPRARFGRAS